RLSFGVERVGDFVGPRAGRDQEGAKKQHRACQRDSMCLHRVKLPALRRCRRVKGRGNGADALSRAQAACPLRRAGQILIQYDKSIVRRAGASIGMTELVAEFATDAEFLTAYDAEVSAGGLLVRGATLHAKASHSGCMLRVRIAGQDVAELSATIASATEG